MIAPNTKQAHTRQSLLPKGFTMQLRIHKLRKQKHWKVVMSQCSRGKNSAKKEISVAQDNWGGCVEYLSLEFF